MIAETFETSSFERQKWLEAVTVELRKLFKSKSWTVPDTVRVSIGWPKGARRAIGQCWYPEGSSDSYHEVFVSPEINDGQRIMDVLAHELVHTITGKSAKHGQEFREIAEAVGLTGKMTETVAGPEFIAWSFDQIKALGGYPAGSLSKVEGPAKQTTRMIKCTCKECGYTLRAAMKWLEIAIPHCPVDRIQLTVEGGDE